MARPAGDLVLHYVDGLLYADTDAICNGICNHASRGDDSDVRCDYDNRGVRAAQGDHEPVD